MAALPPPATATVGSSTAALPHRRLTSIKLAPFTSLATTITVLSPTASAQAISKDQLVSSLTDLENVINGAVDIGGGAVGFLRRVFDAVRPGVEVAVPVVKQAGSKALELAAPIVASASKQAQNSLESVGIDTTPALNVAKTVAGVVQQAPKVVEGAKPIASATVETIASLDFGDHSPGCWRGGALLLPSPTSGFSHCL